MCSVQCGQYTCKHPARRQGYTQHTRMHRCDLPLLHSTPRHYTAPNCTSRNLRDSSNCFLCHICLRFVGLLCTSRRIWLGEIIKPRKKLCTNRDGCSGLTFALFWSFLVIIESFWKNKVRPLKSAGKMDSLRILWLCTEPSPYLQPAAFCGLRPGSCAVCRVQVKTTK